MSRRTILQILAVVACAAAAFVSYKLLAKHMTGSSGSAWFEAGCTAGEETSGVSCVAVLASPHSYWPAKKPGEPPGRPHIPVAFLGLVYFSMLGVWLAGVGQPSASRRWFHLIPLAWVLCGLVVSGNYTYIMYAALEEWCPWCVLTHVLNLLITICVILLWPRRARRTSTGSAPSPAHAAETAQLADAHAIPAARVPAVPAAKPSWGRVVGTIGVMAVMVYGNYGQSGLLTVRKTNSTLKQCFAAISRIKADTAKLVNNWRLADVQTIAVRPDDPVRTKAAADRESIEMVVFSDFACPSCRRFATLLEERIEPLFDRRLEEEDPAAARGALKIVFKHYPLDTQCNVQAGRTVHPTACSAARIAEAVRKVAGNDAFWEVHDLLFAQQLAEHPRAPYDIAGIADKLGLDAKWLSEEMDSAAVTLRIREDTILAKACGVRGTPAVFVEGRLVDPLAILEIEFWKAVVEQFRKETGTPRQTSAEPADQ